MAKPGGLFASQPSAAKLPADIMKGIVDDIDKWMKSKMWPLSCYGFTMYGPCLPGLVDIHPDEMRADAYQHRLPNGQLNRNYSSALHAKEREQLALRDRLLKCLEIADPADRQQLEEFVTSYLRSKGDAKAHIAKPTAQNPSSFSFSNAANSLQQQQIQPPQQQQQQQQQPFETKPLPATAPTVGFSFKAAAASASNPQPVFGSAAPAPAPAPAALPSGSIFAQSGAPKIFSGVQEPAKATPQDDFSYSAVKDLTPEQLQLFQANEFPFTAVPDVPPPRELCWKVM